MERTSEGSPEQERRRAEETLPEALGFVETETMHQMRRSLVEAMRGGEDTRELALRYRLEAEQLTDQESKDSSRLRIGMLVSIALMRRDGGRHDAYLEDIEDALVMAEQEGLDDIALVLGEMLDAG